MSPGVTTKELGSPGKIPPRLVVTATEVTPVGTVTLSTTVLPLFTIGGLAETVRLAAPVDTVRFTAVPCATEVPAVGVWLITLPAGTVALLAVVTAPNVRPAPVKAVVADA